MKYENTSEHTLTVRLDGKAYTARPKGEVEIPDKFARVIQARKLPLKEKASQAPDNKPKS